MSILTIFFNYIFLLLLCVFIGIIGGSLINVFLRVYFDFFFIIWGFYKHYRGTPDKRIYEYLFCFFFYCLYLFCLIYFFWCFYKHYRGTPDKRIYEGLTICFLGFYRHYRVDPWRGRNHVFDFIFIENMTDTLPLLVFERKDDHYKTGGKTRSSI